MGIRLFYRCFIFLIYCSASTRAGTQIVEQGFNFILAFPEQESDAVASLLIYAVPRADFDQNELADVRITFLQEEIQKEIEAPFLSVAHNPVYVEDKHYLRYVFDTEKMAPVFVTGSTSHDGMAIIVQASNWPVLVQAQIEKKTKESESATTIISKYIIMPFYALTDKYTSVLSCKFSCVLLVLVHRKRSKIQVIFPAKHMVTYNGITGWSHTDTVTRGGTMQILIPTGNGADTKTDGTVRFEVNGDNNIAVFAGTKSRKTSPGLSLEHLPGRNIIGTKYLLASPPNQNITVHVAFTEKNSTCNVSTAEGETEIESLESFGEMAFLGMSMSMMENGLAELKIPPNRTIYLETSSPCHVRMIISSFSDAVVSVKTVEKWVGKTMTVPFINKQTATQIITASKYCRFPGFQKTSWVKDYVTFAMNITHYTFLKDCKHFGYFYGSLGESNLVTALSSVRKINTDTTTAATVTTDAASTSGETSVMTTASVAVQTWPTSPAQELRFCRCPCNNETSELARITNQTQDQLRAMGDDLTKIIQQDLQVNRSGLSSVSRRKLSETDMRISAYVMGSTITVVIFVVVFGPIVILDILAGVKFFLETINVKGFPPSSES